MANKQIKQKALFKRRKANAQGYESFIIPDDISGVSQC